MIESCFSFKINNKQQGNNVNSFIQTIFSDTRLDLKTKYHGNSFVFKQMIVVNVLFFVIMRRHFNTFLSLINALECVHSVYGRIQTFRLTYFYACIYVLFFQQHFKKHTNQTNLQVSILKKYVQT